MSSVRSYLYTTKVGERLDQICARRYGSSAGDVVVFAYTANPGLEGQGIILEPGTVISLPDLPVTASTTVVRDQVFLWE